MISECMRDKYKKQDTVEKAGYTLGSLHIKYKVVQMWPGLIVCKLVTVCPGHIWTTLYYPKWETNRAATAFRASEVFLS
jgi:hypothetical protein